MKASTKHQDEKKTHQLEKTAGQALYDSLASRTTAWEKLSKAAQAIYETRANTKK
jgi:hypothetical protein